MKWKAKQKPDVGDVRHIKRFAWLPTEVQGHMLWLEFYDERQWYSARHKLWITDYKWKWSRSPAP